MRKKHFFWMLQIIMVLVLSITMANAQQYELDVDPQIYDGQVINENLNDGIIDINVLSVCDDCALADKEGKHIYYNNNCTEPTNVDPQNPVQASGIFNAFDRDAAFDFTLSGVQLVASWDASWWDTAPLYTGRSHIGYCENSTDNYLFALCNCVLKTQFLRNTEYVFEVEIIGDGVYWTNRNLSLFNDVADGVFVPANLTTKDGSPAVPYGAYGDNVIRYVIGNNKNFFCGTDWWTQINADDLGWRIGADGNSFSWYLNYVGVKDYITRTYKQNDFSQSTCSANQIPFNLTESNGAIQCPVDPKRWNFVNAKILRSHKVVLFPSGYPLSTQNPYLYLDLPTMIYKPGVGPNLAELGDNVDVMITVALPFLGICAQCCNLPMCSCLQRVGTFGCTSDDSDNGKYYRCVPYLTSLVGDWWDAIAVANMYTEEISPVISFYANGQKAEYPMGPIAPQSVEAVPLSVTISDYIAANFSSFPLEDVSMYAQVTVTGTSKFDVFALIYHPDFGSTSMLSRCNACGICADCK